MIYERTGRINNRSDISWGAVFGGWIFACAFAFLLYVLGAAAGVTTMSALNKFSLGVTVGTGLWMGIAWIIATWCGAYFAGRMSGRYDKGTGALHGMIVWGFSSVMTLIFASIQIGAATTAGANAAQGIAQAGASAGQAIGGSAGEVIKQASGNLNVQSESLKRLRSEVRQNISKSLGQNSQVSSAEIDRALQQIDDQTLRDVSVALIAGNTQQAKQTLAQRTTLSTSQIDRVADGVNQSARQYGEELKGKAAVVAEQASDYASGALWAAFFLGLLGLGAGAWGGSEGARRAVEVYGVDYAPADAPARSVTARTETTAYEKRHVGV